MAVQQLKPVDRAMLLIILAKPDAMRFVHADMNTIRSEAAAKRGQCRANPRIRFRLVNHQHAVVILDIPIDVPLQELFQMRQRLYAGNQLHAGLCRIIVHLAKLFFRIPPTQIAQIGCFRHGIGVLGIEHHQVQSQCRVRVNHPLDRFHRHHAAAGHIQHHAAGCDMPRLMQLRNVLTVPKGARRQKQSSRCRRNIRCLYGQPLSIHQKAQFFSFLEADLARPITSCQREHALSECFARFHHVLLLSVHLHEINRGAAMRLFLL